MLLPAGRGWNHVRFHCSPCYLLWEIIKKRDAWEKKKLEIVFRAAEHGDRKGCTAVFRRLLFCLLITERGRASPGAAGAVGSVGSASYGQAVCSCSSEGSGDIQALSFVLLQVGNALTWICFWTNQDFSWIQEVAVCLYWYRLKSCIIFLIWVQVLLYQPSSC